MMCEGYMLSAWSSGGKTDAASGRPCRDLLTDDVMPNVTAMMQQYDGGKLGAFRYEKIKLN